MPHIYLDEFNRVAKRAYAMWNRDPSSPSYGSFDRLYWGWKFKDLSDASLQYGVRFAIQYAELKGLTGSLSPWLVAYVEYCAKLQHADGSFDQCYPFERTPGVVYDILSTLIVVRQSPYLASEKARSLLDGIIERAVRFALHTDEKHGEVANHLASYAYELINYEHMIGGLDTRSKSQRYLDRLLANFDSTEGWFLEYHGPDAGYQTRCLRYLAKIAVIRGDSSLWSVVAKAADFVGELLMPDGSLHPMLGCRSSALVFPSAFELLAERDPRYLSLAHRIREGWENGMVPLPSEIDFANALRLGDDALDAFNASRTNPSTLSKVGDEDILVGHRDFPNAGIAIRRNHNISIYVAYRLGGVAVAYQRQESGQWVLKLEDSGYLIRSLEKFDSWLTRMPGSGRLLELSDQCIKLEANFYKSLHDEVTPLRLIILRMLNLTVLRWQWVGDLFRQFVVKKLMSGLYNDPLTLRREITISPSQLNITDSIEGNSRLNAAGFSLLRCRRTTGIHMATSRYFQEQELQPVQFSWTERESWPTSSGSKFQVAVDFEAEGWQ
ncbi:MAG: hypothetical protein FIA96_15265 [Betaproteobacteria bacterium]|nr:hypothetical protein [Betaproteobacteria bacterium]